MTNFLNIDIKNAPSKTRICLVICKLYLRKVKSYGIVIRNIFLIDENDLHWGIYTSQSIKISYQLM